MYVNVQWYRVRPSTLALLPSWSASDAESTGHRSRDARQPIVVAVFDDWDALHAVLAGLKSDITLRSGAVLHARNDALPVASSFGILKEMAHLRFSRHATT
jgi:hypothetical protein